MLEQELKSQSSTTKSTDANQTEFESSKWLAYFLENKNSQVVPRLKDDFDLGQELKKPLIHSLKRFQIGETGDGLHLKRYAKTVADKDYIECVDLFVKEEQGHAQNLASVILALDGTLLTWHWSDLAFIGLRRILGLKTELLILLIAEVIGKCFYKLVAANSNSEELEEVFSLIVLDELMHLEFHTEFLVSRLGNYPSLVRSAIYHIWCGLFVLACFAFVADHRQGLRALDSSMKKFFAESRSQFAKYAKRACGLN